MAATSAGRRPKQRPRHPRAAAASRSRYSADRAARSDSSDDWEGDWKGDWKGAAMSKLTVVVVGAEPSMLADIEGALEYVAVTAKPAGTRAADIVALNPTAVLVAVVP